MAKISKSATELIKILQDKKKETQKKRKEQDKKINKKISSLKIKLRKESEKDYAKLGKILCEFGAKNGYKIIDMNGLAKNIFVANSTYLVSNKIIEKV